MAGYNPWTWTCSGIGGGSPSPTCSAKAAAGQGIDGQCGAATGYYILPDTAPTNGLCKVAGQPPGPSYNSATGVWNWLCTGINGGISVNCSSSPVSTAAAAATTVPKPASPLPGSSQTWSPAALHADSYGNVYVNYGTGIDRISSPAGLAVSCVNTSNGQCTGGLWTAYGDTQFCYINKYDYSTSPPTIGLSCGASSRTASPSLYFAVDSTGKHVYYTDSYRSGGNYVVYDVGSAVVGGGVGGVYLAAPTLTMDRDDNLYIGDENVIYKYDPNANITTTVAYLASGATATSVAADPHTGALFFVVSKPGYFGPGTYLYQGNLAIGQATGMYVTGLTDQNGQALAGHTPGAVALDSLDNLYILDASSPARVVMVTGAVQGGGSGGGGAGKAGSGVSAPVVNGYCGDAPWEFFNTKPTADLCDGGTASAVAGSGPWTWSCTGSAFGSSPSCSTYPVVLTVTANNASMVQGGPLPSLTASYTGLVNGDAAGDVLTGAPSLTTNATVNSPPGNYPITAAQGTLQSEVYNGRTFYNFAFVNGVLSVTKAPAAQLSVAAVFARVSNAYQATVTVTNSGTADAANVHLTTATLATANGSLLPQSQAKVTAGGGTATFVVTFPLTAGADGASVPAKFAGTYNGGSFSVSMRSVTLP
ncbi:hypothetical protein SBA3_250009 [Candidatus Sulfopaludibacter sp. SbA3]|nr:hypothetical protein SBA3_250009 [Candidatus Sulfopaludibacter sp. SbA3]